MLRTVSRSISSLELYRDKVMHLEEYSKSLDFIGKGELL